ncbi:Crp/Fnr family transcriptional regulator [Vibrio astriarenae]|uniref:Crp/Fnr family transcriptional regulator n=1 Tax=Vibrio astriarenae TaxID=1481923 RepID=UPI003736DE64
MINIKEDSQHSLAFSRYSKRQAIYQSGSPSSGVYYVDSGLVGLYQVSETGKESLLRIYGPGSYFGYRSLFTNQNYPSTARAMLNSTVVHAKVNSFKELDKQSPELANYLMKEVCFELGEAEKRLMQFTAFSAKKRILDSVLHVFDLYPNYPWTYREISEYSGTDISTVIRYCKKLKELGYLIPESRKPVPVDLQQLAKYKNNLLQS